MATRLRTSTSALVTSFGAALIVYARDRKQLELGASKEEKGGGIKLAWISYYYDTTVYCVVGILSCWHMMSCLLVSILPWR